VSFEARVNDPDFHKRLYLDEETGNLRLTINDPDGDAMSIDLNDTGVGNLRKALQRYERQSKAPVTQQ
jgi:hypothetical protein